MLFRLCRYLFSNILFHIHKWQMGDENCTVSNDMTQLKLTDMDLCLIFIPFKLIKCSSDNMNTTFKDDHD